MKLKDKTILERPIILETLVILLISLIKLPYGITYIALIILIGFQAEHDKKFVDSLKDNLREKIKSELDEDIEYRNQVLESKKQEVEKLENLKNDADTKLAEVKENIEKFEKQESNIKNRISKLRPAHKAIKNSIEFYRENSEYEDLTQLALDELHPTVKIPLHTHDVKTLKQQSKLINKEIDKLLASYEKRYTTKANKSLYASLVIAMQAELQNILISLKYDKIEQTKLYIHDIAKKYLDIAAKGNQNIYSTLTRFIGEIEGLFLQLAEVEYHYYVKRERQKEEQRLLRAQMRQETAERKRLEEDRKKIEAEESKYHTEIDSLTAQIENETDNTKLSQLEQKILELQNLLAGVEEKKEEIINLQNGKAGNVYIISNVGSFGENTFKVGMTRRLEPMERIKELSGASVPFAFDVHSFIFSEDAPALEKKIHDILHDKRVNKINLRKEFFNVSLTEMESLVSELEPTAEFRKTLIAQEYEATLEIEREEIA